jgi:hypothetical protein
LIVDLKFLTVGLTVEVSFEGRARRLEVLSVSAEGDAPLDLDTLTGSFQDMSMSSHAFLWTVTWDTHVSVVSSEERTQKKDPQVRK